MIFTMRLYGKGPSRRTRQARQECRKDGLLLAVREVPAPCRETAWSRAEPENAILNTCQT